MHAAEHLHLRGLMYTCLMQRCTVESNKVTLLFDVNMWVWLTGAALECGESKHTLRLFLVETELLQICADVCTARAVVMRHLADALPALLVLVSGCSLLLSDGNAQTPILDRSRNAGATSY